MEYIYFILKILTLIASGTLLLRISGRKSISQMTIAQTIIMISIGSLIIQPIIDKNIWRTLAAATIFIVFLIFVEWLQLKFNFIEKIITGKAKVIIKNGQLIPENLKKIRLTVDQLEIRLREKGVTKISDIKVATLEPNGMLGYELIEDAKPLTKGEFKKMMSNYITSQNQSNIQTNNLFQEVIQSDRNINNNLKQ